MIPEIVRKSSLLAGLFFMACGGKDTSGPSAVPTTVALANGGPQSAVAGSVVTPALTFSVKDQNGNPLAGVPVTITVTAGGGSITGAPTTTSAGETPIGTFTLGTIVGVNTITIKAGDLAPITFSITTVAGPPTQIVVVSGANQTALAGTTLTGISVKVADQFGNGVAGRTVSISVTEGGGLVLPPSGTTNASGVISGISWTLGRSALPQTISFQSGAIATTVKATVATAYSLEVRYFGDTPAPAIQDAFTNAAARIRGSIVGTVGPVPFVDVNLNTNCGVPVILNETINDVVIFAQIKPIDGKGKILGSAGPCLIRRESRLTVIGVMQFDVDDLNTLVETNRLEAVILHEMLHVVGIGTLWDQKTPSLLVGAGGGDPRFVGQGATSACVASGGTSLCAGGVAVENCVGIPSCGGGTRDSHWREGTSSAPGFDSELMTGFIEGPGIATPYSNMSIQSLLDLGYGVNAFSADPYTVPSPSLRALLQMDGPSNIEQWETVRFPKAIVSRSGVIQRLERQ